MKRCEDKVEYSLAEFGRTLEPTLKEMLKWGEMHGERLEETDKSP